uniref:ATP synthase F0 subunit 6 n=1 Tax=Mycetophylax simplex TaxID=341688 RepID=UPI0030020C97
MMNLFTLFDPSTSMTMSFNWLSMVIFLMLLPYQFWLIPSRSIFLWNLLINYMFNEFKMLTSKYSYSNLIIMINLMLFIFFNNLLGLFPYIFTASSHMSFSLSLSMSIWISIILFFIFNYLNNLLSHLTPLGTPTLLMPFMVIIESISLIIRPFTLAIRLSANMIAGHLLLSLLGTSSSNLNNQILFNVMIFTQIMLFILEISVSMIQAYVFSILSTLYMSEN